MSLEKNMCCSWLVLNKPELPSSLPCFARSSGPPYMCLFLFTNCRHEFQMPSWAKGKRTGLASWSPGPRTHWELDRTSVCGSYSWELKTSPSLSLVLRAVPLEEEWQPTPVFLPGKHRGQRGLVGYTPWGRKEPDTTERLSKGQHACQGGQPGV